MRKLIKKTQPKLKQNLDARINIRVSSDKLDIINKNNIDLPGMIRDFIDNLCNELRLDK